MKSKRSNDNEIDENKIDFDLLNSRRQTQQSTSSDSSAILSDTSQSNQEIWPLHLTPTFINHYITGDVIGTGSYAEVRECVDTRSLERSAMKIINRPYLQRQAPRALRNQLQEIRLLRHLQHANIIQMHETFFQGSFIYIVLEYCSFNLNELLNDQPDTKFPVSFARRCFHQLCFGVGYLHSVGIVHRDIKPDNLLLTNSGILKIVDFGVSHILSIWEREDLCSNYEGTPLFQAPEVISGQAVYRGYKVDIWSCGITLYLMLYGTYPFTSEALLDLYDKILGDDFEIPQKEPTSGALTDLIAMMLEKDCQRRADISQVLQHPWLKLCHANLYDTDEYDNGEFFDLVVRRHKDQDEKFRLKDIYKSMSSLPYIYRHHYPHMPIRKSRSSLSVNSGSGHDSSTEYKREKINSLSSTTSTTYSTANESSSSQPSGSVTASSSDNGSGSDPEMDRNSNLITDEANQVEWGTEAQYQLMKLPQIRANRVRRTLGRTHRKRRRKLVRKSDRSTK